MPKHRMVADLFILLLYERTKAMTSMGWLCLGGCKTIPFLPRPEPAIHTGFKSHQKTQGKRQQKSNRGKSLISLCSAPDRATWLFSLILLKHIYNLSGICSFPWNLPAWEQHLPPKSSHLSLSVPLSATIKEFIRKKGLLTFLLRNFLSVAKTQRQENTVLKELLGSTTFSEPHSEKRRHRTIFALTCDKGRSILFLGYTLYRDQYMYSMYSI